MIQSRTRSNSQFSQQSLIGRLDMKSQYGQIENGNPYIVQNQQKNQITQFQQLQAMELGFNYQGQDSSNINNRQERQFRHKKSNSIDSLQLNGLKGLPQNQQLNSQQNYQVAVIPMRNNSNNSQVKLLPPQPPYQQLLQQQQQYHVPQNQIIHSQNYQMPNQQQQINNSNLINLNNNMEMLTPRKQNIYDLTNSSSSIKNRSTSESNNMKNFNNNPVKHSYPQKILLNSSQQIRSSMNNTPQSQSPPIQNKINCYPQQQQLIQQQLQLNNRNNLINHSQTKLLNQTPPKILFQQTRSLLNSKQYSNSKNLPPFPLHSQSPLQDFNKSSGQIQIGTTLNPLMSTMRSRSLATEPFLNYDNERQYTDRQYTQTSYKNNGFNNTNSSSISKVSKLNLSLCQNKEGGFSQQSDRFYYKNSNNQNLQQGALSDRSHLFQAQNQSAQKSIQQMDSRLCLVDQNQHQQKYPNGLILQQGYQVHYPQLENQKQQILNNQLLQQPQNQIKLNLQSQKQFIPLQQQQQLHQLNIQRNQQFNNSQSIYQNNQIQLMPNQQFIATHSLVSDKTVKYNNQNQLQQIRLIPNQQNNITQQNILRGKSLNTNENISQSQMIPVNNKSSQMFLISQPGQKNTSPMVLKQQQQDKIQNSTNVAPKNVNGDDPISIKYKAIKQKLSNLTSMSNELLNKSQLDVNQRVEKMIQEQIAVRQREIKELNNDKQDGQIEEIKIIIESKKPPKNQNYGELNIEKLPQKHIEINYSSQKMKESKSPSSHLELISNKIDEIQQNLQERRSSKQHNDELGQKQVLQNLNLNNQENQQIKSLQNRIHNSLKKSQKNLQSSVQESYETFYKLGGQSIDADVSCFHFSKDIYSEGEQQSNMKNVIKSIKQDSYCQQSLNNQLQKSKKVNQQISSKNNNEDQSQIVNEQPQISKRNNSREYEIEIKINNDTQQNSQNTYEYSQPLTVICQSQPGLLKDTVIVSNQYQKNNSKYNNSDKNESSGQNNISLQNSADVEQNNNTQKQNNFLNQKNNIQTDNKNISSPMQNDFYFTKFSPMQSDRMNENTTSIDNTQQSNVNNKSIQQKKIQVPVLEFINPGDKSEMIPFRVQTEFSEIQQFDEGDEQSQGQFHEQFAEEISQKLNNKEDQTKQIFFTKNKSFNQPVQLSSRVEDIKEIKHRPSNEISAQRYRNEQTEESIEQNQQQYQDNLQVYPEKLTYPLEKEIILEENQNSKCSVAQKEFKLQEFQDSCSKMSSQDQKRKLDIFDSQNVRDTFDILAKKKNRNDTKNIEINIINQQNVSSLLDCGNTISQGMDLQMISPQTIMRADQENKDDYSDSNSEHTDISQIEQKITCENILLEDSIQKTRELKDKLQRIRLETGIDIEKYVEKIYINLGQSVSSSKEQLFQIIQQNITNNNEQSEMIDNLQNDNTKIISKEILHFTPASSIQSQEKFHQLNCQQSAMQPAITQQENEKLQQNLQSHQRNRYLSELLLQKQEQKIQEIEETESFQKRLMKRVQKKSSNSSNASSVIQQQQQQAQPNQQYFQISQHQQQQNNSIQSNQEYKRINIPYQSEEITLESYDQMDPCITQSFQTALTENQLIDTKNLLQDPNKIGKKQLSNISSQNLSTSIQSKQTNFGLNTKYNSSNENQEIPEPIQFQKPLNQTAKEVQNNLIEAKKIGSIKSSNTSQYELSSDFSSSSLQKVDNQQINNPNQIKQQINFEAYYNQKQLQQQLIPQGQGNETSIQPKQLIEFSQFNQGMFMKKPQNQDQQKQIQPLDKEYQENELEKMNHQDLLLFMNKYLQNINAQKKNYKKQYKNLKMQLKPELSIIQQNLIQNQTSQHHQLYAKIEFYLKDIKAKINYVELQKTDLDKKNFNCQNNKEIIQNYLKYSQLITKGINKIASIFFKIKEIQKNILQQSLNSTMNFNPMIDDLIHNNFLKSEQEWEEVFNQEQMLAQAQEKIFLEIVHKYNKFEDAQQN